MEIMTIVIVVFAVIGLSLDMSAFPVKMKSSQEAAELMLLNAEQEANSIYEDKLEREVSLLNEAKAKADPLKRSTIEAKEFSENTAEEVWTLNLSQSVKNSRN